MPVADIYHLLVDVPSYVSLAALITFCLLLVLYFSQRRDIQRLTTWMQAAPGHPASDLAASEALLDRTEAELEEIMGGAESAPEPTEEPVREPTLVAPPPTGERPALERITMEREALLPHARWRRTMRRISQPRILGLIALGAVVLGLAAIFVSDRFLNTGGPSRGSHAPKVAPASVSVAVLNGTSVPGLAAKVGDDVRANGFKLGTESNSKKTFGQTVVMYDPHQRAGAQEVAHDLGVKPIQPIDQQTQQASAGADVVVIAGADRAKP
jgi:hypothetical protein